MFHVQCAVGSLLQCAVACSVAKALTPLEGRQTRATVLFPPKTSGLRFLAALTSFVIEAIVSVVKVDKVVT